MKNKILLKVFILIVSILISAFLTQIGTLRLTHGFDTKGWIKDILIYTPLILALILALFQGKNFLTNN